MTKTLNRQFALIFGLLMAGTILLCWLINSLFLEDYYIYNKQDVLKQAYSNINEAASSGDIDNNEFDMELEKTCGIYNIDVIVIDSDSKTVKSSVRDAQMLAKQLLDNVFLEREKDDIILQKEENYIIQQTHDMRSNINYIEMWGMLDNGFWFLIRSPLEGIKDSVAVANKFLAYVGIVAAIASGIIVLVVTKRITKPVMQLAKISERMKNLDFEAKYTGTAKNEIGILGEHINQLSDTLEKTISELKTANNELQNDIEHKEKIDDMRKEFLSNVSHELKTPIALIMGYAEGLKIDINDDVESREFYCDVIMDEANKMNIMVKKLLTLNQLEFGNETIVMERFDIVELIRNYILSCDILVKQNEATVRFDEKDPIYVWGDEFKIEEVFMNYFSNALNHISYTKKIEVSIERFEDRVRIKVFNTGDPIPDDCIDNIWEKFYKVDKARTREYGGSGVGLSIVKAIMDSLNQNYGAVNYETGVEFWFELATK